jgi:cytochrome P450
MLQNPDIQRKGQAAVDKVLGDRLPNFSDMDSIPFVDAIMKECLRWQQVVPLGSLYSLALRRLSLLLFVGLPHVASADDIYKGYSIPKGSVLVGNAWYWKLFLR